MIQLTNVSKRFKKKILFEQVSIEISTNGLYGVVGRNGSGKTTLLKLIQLKEKASKGTVINTYPTVYVDVKKLVFNRLTVWENLRIICDEEAAIEQIIEEFFLVEQKSQPAESLSMGEKVRLAIARAILLKSPVILLDEPTANLDEKNRMVLLDILKHISLERIIIFSTNQEEDLEKSDAIIRIERQKLEASYSSKGYESNVNAYNTYTNTKLLKKSLGGYGYIYRFVSFVFLLFFSIFLSIYCIKAEDIVYNSYDFSKDSNYMLMEKDYFLKSQYDSIDKSKYETQEVKASNLSFWLSQGQIGQGQLLFLKDFELLKKIPTTIFVHYDSLKYNLADDEIAMTEDMYDLFTAFSLIHNSIYSFSDISLKIVKIESGSSFSSVENIMKLNEAKVFQYIDDSIKKSNFDFNDFLSLLSLHLYNGCSVLEKRAKDIENAHIYLNKTTYEELYQRTIRKLPIIEESDLSSYKITPNNFINLDSKHMIISTAFCTTFIKEFRIEDILRGNQPTFYDVGEDLKLYYQVAGVVESDEVFVCFLDDYINEISKDNIKKDFDEIFIAGKEGGNIFKETESDNLALVMQDYHKISERLESMKFLLPSLKPFLVAIGILMGMVLLVFSLVPILRKRHAIVLLANCNRTAILKKYFIFKKSFVSLVCLSLGVLLTIIFIPVISLCIYGLWSFDFVSWGLVIAMHLLGYLWLEVTQSILFFKWVN